MEKNVLDIDGVISTIMRKEDTVLGELKTPFFEIMEILERIHDRSIPEEYHETITNLSNQADKFLHTK